MGVAALNTIRQDNFCLGKSYFVMDSPYGGYHRIRFIQIRWTISYGIVATAHRFYAVFFIWAESEIQMGGICAFFGHRDTLITAQLEEQISQTLRRLIDEGIDEFWCCEQGTFDWICHKILLEVKKDYPFIQICCICAYNPSSYPKIRQDSMEKRYDYLIYNDEIANGANRFAIVRRNRYIAENVDVILCYIEHKNGGAYNAVKYAHKQGVKIINLGLMKE